jgi:hypothetical protein
MRFSSEEKKGRKEGKEASKNQVFRSGFHSENGSKNKSR